MTSFPSAIFLCTSSSLFLTIGKTATGDTKSLTSFSLIFLVTSFPFKYIFPFGYMSICNLFNISSILFSSFTSIFSWSIFNATHRNVAPVSIFTNPNFSPTNLVMVPFPAPAGPSIATINDIFLSFWDIISKNVPFLFFLLSYTFLYVLIKCNHIYHFAFWHVFNVPLEHKYF